MSLVLHLKENLLEALFSLIKVTLLYWVKLGLGTLLTLCAIGIVFLKVLPVKLWSGGRGWRLKEVEEKTLPNRPPPQKWRRESNVCLQQFSCVYFLHCTNTHRVNLLSPLYWCLIQWTIVFRVLVLFFFLTMLKYLNCIDCWLSLEKKQNYLSCITEVGIVQGWDKAFFNPFLHTT